MQTVWSVLFGCFTKFYQNESYTDKSRVNVNKTASAHVVVSVWERHLKHQHPKNTGFLACHKHGAGTPTSINRRGALSILSDCKRDLWSPTMLRLQTTIQDRKWTRIVPRICWFWLLHQGKRTAVERGYRPPNVSGERYVLLGEGGGETSIVNCYICSKA